jgi:hypothetical protein
MDAWQAVDDAGILQVTQAGCEQRAGDAWQPTLDLVEPVAPENQLAHDEQRPSIGHNLRCPRYWTVLLVLLHAESWHP